ERAVEQERLKGVRRVINASGVVIHTNLGRAPLSEAARRAVENEAARYCTLEYDLETGERGRRGARVERLLTDWTGAEDALVAHEAGLLLYEDAGSGALLNLSSFNMADEPVISESIRSGADIVSFSGDKLLGAAQAGLIVGRHELIKRLRKHPLYRALRTDKLALAALEATLDAYRRDAAFREVPVLNMITLTV